MMLRSRLGKETVEIPICVKGGEVRVLAEEGNSESLPELKEGTVGTLRVRARSIRKKEDYERFAGEAEEIIIPSGQKVWMLMKPRSEQSRLSKQYLQGDSLCPPAKGGRMIPVTLREHLWLRHRGAKDAVVKSCVCALPEQLQEEVDNGDQLSSLNQAYTRLSEIFETHRSTHTGRIYTKAHVWNPNLDEWTELDTFRKREPGCIWKGRSWLRPWWITSESSQEGLFESAGSTWATIEIQKQGEEWKVKLVDARGEVEELGKFKAMRPAIKDLEGRNFRPYDPVGKDHELTTVPVEWRQPN